MAKYFRGFFLAFTTAADCERDYRKAHLTRLVVKRDQNIKQKVILRGWLHACQRSASIMTVAAAATDSYFLLICCSTFVWPIIFQFKDGQSYSNAVSMV